MSNDILGIVRHLTRPWEIKNRSTRGRSLVVLSTWRHVIVAFAISQVGALFAETGEDIIFVAELDLLCPETESRGACRRKLISLFGDRIEFWRDRVTHRLLNSLRYGISERKPRFIILSQAVRLLARDLQLFLCLRSRFLLHPVDALWVFNDTTNLARRLFLAHGGHVLLLEDGQRNYEPFRSLYPPVPGSRAVLRNFAHRTGLAPYSGRHPRVSTIFVQEPRRLPEDIFQKGRFFDYLGCFNGLSFQDKERLLTAFSISEQTCQRIRKADAVLLTTPAHVFGITREESLSVHQAIVAGLIALGFSVVVKPHPSDQSYKGLCSEGTTVIGRDFPAELLMLARQDKFRVSVSLFSSSMAELFAERVIRVASTKSEILNLVNHDNVRASVTSRLHKALSNE